MIDSEVPSKRLLTPASLSLPVLARLENTLQHDTERLIKEKDVYKDAVVQQRLRSRRLEQTIQTTAEMLGSEDNLPAVEEAFRNEIEMLSSTCTMTRKELGRLQNALREQAVIESQIDAAYGKVADEQNALCLEAEAFDDDHAQLSRILSDLREQEKQLLSVELPTYSYRLVVDTERGLRYPLINDLRLAFKPKGDLDWKEIAAAWALAAQLLLSIANLFGFQSQTWRVVPLSSCAKIIYTPANSSKAKVFNLGHPQTKGSKALLTWNALLCQVLHHVKKQVSTQLISWNDKSDHNMTPTTIGNIGLTTGLDDATWARAIHLMSYNLLWLSNVSSHYLKQHVMLSLDSNTTTTPTAD